MNYRSEPFMNRLALQQQTVGRFDKSAAYSSYVFGDPATPIARSYLGDPVKQRVVHGGSEVFHVHHVHGGSIRWRRQPGAEPTGFDRGLDKRPPLLPQATERTDSQAIGPSETYDVEHECGSGGCQQGAGDYMVHCHVAHHYLAGMWTIWRVYNTKQDVSLPGRPAAPGRAAGPGWPDAHGRDLSRAGGPHRGLEGDKSSRSPRRTWERGWSGSYRPGEFLEATTPRCWTGSERVTST